MIPIAKSKKSKALIVEGGGMRGAFAGGALASMCKYYPATNFDLLVGVSAGSCSLVYYATEDEKKLISKKNILKIWRDELHKDKFISFKELFRLKRVMKREYIVDTLFKEKYKLFLEKFKQRNVYITVSNLKTVLPEYIKVTGENFFEVLRSAISLPVATKGIHYLGDLFLSDGGIMDPIPIKSVIEKGYKDITLVLNQPRNHFSEQTSKFLSYLSFPKLKSIRDFLRNEHHIKYNEAKELILNPPKDVSLKIIDPKINFDSGIITTNQKKLIKLLEHGWNEAEKIFKK
jgi:predicted patatin/cPLA2 family phospholipase